MSSTLNGWAQRPPWIAGAYLLNTTATPDAIAAITQHENRSTRRLAIQDERCPEDIAIAAYLAD